MRKNRRNLFGLLLLLCIACIVLVACRMRDKAEVESASKVTENSAVEYEDEVKQFEAEDEEPLVVFYDSGIVPVVLSNFMLVHPEVKLEVYGLSGDDFEDVQNTIATYGHPDIWLFAGTGQTKKHIANLYELGMIADMRNFISEEQNLNTLDYVGGTFTSLDNGDIIFGLPLTWKKRCLIIRDSQWRNSELAYLSENFTGEEFYKTLITESEKVRPDNGIFWADSTFYFWSDIYELGLVQEKENEVIIDEELFNMVLEFTLEQEKINEEVRNLYSRNTGASTGRPDLFQGTPALDPAMYAGNYLGCSLNGAPQVTSVYAKSMTELHGEGIYMYYIPTFGNGDEYIANVAEFAMVGGTSSRQQQAYEVIRLMMDTPMELITQPSGRTSMGETYSPVNIELALQLLDYFETAEGELNIFDRVGNLFYTVEKKQLSENEKEQMEELITGIVDLSFQYVNDEAREVFMLYYYEYMSNGVLANPKYCYLEIMQALNPNSEKWNMTQEEMDAFLNE